MNGILSALKCAKCGTPVKRWETYANVENGLQHFRAYCHGEIDECEIDFRDMPPNTIIEAVAFASPKLIP